MEYTISKRFKRLNDDLNEEFTMLKKAGDAPMMKDFWN